MFGKGSLQSKDANLHTTILFALAGSFGVFHVFYHWLKVPLPMGVLGI